MKIEKLELEGLLHIQLRVFHDNRGFFVERFNEERFKSFGLPTSFVQDNFSRSEYAVIRGLHYQHTPPQGKLVSCTRGEVFDVAVDMRKSSPTFGKHVSVMLNGTNPTLLWIPPGFAHGFCVTSREGADVMYKVDNLWNGAGEGCVLWNDPDIGIKWPVENPVLSQKDLEGIPLKKITIPFP